MDYIPGSLKFFENFSVEGLKPIRVDATPGYIHITLVADKGTNTDTLRARYISKITPQLPVGHTIKVSIEGSGLK